jgi:hypothetical protein
MRHVPALCATSVLIDAEVDSLATLGDVEPGAEPGLFERSPESVRALRVVLT